MKKNEGIKAILSEGGKYLFDISKLIFGGVILAAIMRHDIDSSILFIAGSVAVIELIIFLGCVSAVALLIAVWGAIQLHKMD